VATPQVAVQVSTIVPTFTVDDLQRSTAFYEVLGFTVDERWEDNGRLLGVMMRAGKIQIGLNHDDWGKGATARRGPACGCPCRCRRRGPSTRWRGG